jgi:hypothetical protein
MISISRLIPTDGQDIVVIQTNQDFRENTARMVRTKLLNGEVFINYSGVSDGDRTITLDETMTKEQSDVLWEMYNVGLPVRISIPDGVFKAGIRSCRPGNGQTTATIYIESRED